MASFLLCPTDVEVVKEFPRDDNEKKLETKVNVSKENRKPSNNQLQPLEMNQTINNNNEVIKVVVSKKINAASVPGTPSACVLGGHRYNKQTVMKLTKIVKDSLHAKPDLLSRNKIYERVAKTYQTFKKDNKTGMNENESKKKMKQQDVRMPGTNGQDGDRMDENNMKKETEHPLPQDIHMLLLLCMKSNWFTDKQGSHFVAWCEEQGW